MPADETALESSTGSIPSARDPAALQDTAHARMQPFLGNSVAQ